MPDVHATTLQVFDQADFPSIRPHQHDNRAYRLSLMPRALRVFKLAHVNIQPLVAAQGGLMGELACICISQHVLDVVNRCNLCFWVGFACQHPCKAVAWSLCNAAELIC